MPVFSDNVLAHLRIRYVNLRLEVIQVSRAVKHILGLPRRWLRG